MAAHPGRRVTQELERRPDVPQAPPANLRAVTDALQRWMAARDYASWDPYDGLTSPWLQRFTGPRLAARVAMQVVKRSPVNLRPLLRIERRVLTKSLSDLLSASLLLSRLDEDPAALERGRNFARALRARALDAATGYSWGMDLPYASRFVRAGVHTPNLFQTVNAAVAFVDLYEVTGDDEDLRPAVQAVEWMQHDLGRVESNAEQQFWRYYPDQDAVVYNVNAQAAVLLCRVAGITGRDDLATQARRTLDAVLAAQNADGSWFYARGGRGRWVDGFHSGYVLEALNEYTRRSPYAEAERALERGMEFFRARLLEPNGLPRYTSAGTYPIDAQNCAQAIQLLARMAQRDAAWGTWARRAYAQSARALLVWRGSGDGARAYFRMQRGRWMSNDLPAIRWSVAPMLLALAHLRAATETAHAARVS